MRALNRVQGNLLLNPLNAPTVGRLKPGVSNEPTGWAAARPPGESTTTWQESQTA